MAILDIPELDADRLRALDAGVLITAVVLPSGQVTYCYTDLSVGDLALNPNDFTDRFGIPALATVLLKVQARA